LAALSHDINTLLCSALKFIEPVHLLGGPIMHKQGCEDLTKGWVVLTPTTWDE